MRTVAWHEAESGLRLIDQRLLPSELRFLTLHTFEEVAAAIRDMVVRGAPAIGATAAFGYALAALGSTATTIKGMKADLHLASEVLQEARPTAVNLFWALKRMERAFHSCEGVELNQIKAALLAEAQKIADEDVEINQRMGQIGAELIQDGDTVLHHCNTGALATVDYGTALGVIRTAHEQGKRLHVLVNETRPRLQGARLTAWELDQYGIPYDIIVDSAAGYFLRTGAVTAVFVGADRVASNGDVVNKIGTYPLALAAKDNKVPFYAVVPISTIDPAIQSGMDIPIEERPSAEVRNIIWEGRPAAAIGSHARNPAFDCTPHSLITALITEVGILREPFDHAISEARRKADIR